MRKEKTNPYRENESAPYRFVPLNQVVAKSPVAPYLKGLRHGAYRDGDGNLKQEGLKKNHLDATLTLDWIPETPFVIGESQQDGVVAPYRLGKNGPYAIPGSSIKGMIRSVMEIVCYGRLTQINGHHRYGYRDFSPDYKGRMTNEDNIKAGWLSCENGVWKITPARWYKLEIAEIAQRFNKSPNNWVTTQLLDKYRYAGRLLNGQKPIVDFTRESEVAFNIKNKHVATLSGDGNKRGIMVFSGSQPAPKSRSSDRKFQKKVEYLFEDIEDAKPEELNEKVFDLFKMNHSKPGKKLSPEGSWKDLQNTIKDKRRIPVFYCGDLRDQNPGTFYFGLTRLFKIPHRYAVRNVLNRTPAHDLNRGKTQVPDIVEALFGFVFEKDEYPEGFDRSAQKGRIAFGFARCKQPPNTIKEKQNTVVMMGPRASFSPFYLAGEELDYSKEKPVLAGRKRYPVSYPENELGERANSEIEKKLRNTSSERDNKEMQTQLRYLIPSPDLRFTGSIRLTNVHPVELGALLWAINFGQADGKIKYRHSLGRGKAFSMGQMRTENLVLNGKTYEDTGIDNSNIQDYLDQFKAYMQSMYQDWPKYRLNATFERICDPEIGAEMRKDGKLNYLGDHRAHSNLKKQRQDEERCNKKPLLPSRLLITQKPKQTT